MVIITKKNLRDYLHGKDGGLTFSELKRWYDRREIADNPLDGEIEDFWNYSLGSASADKDKIASAFNSLVSSIAEIAPAGKTIIPVIARIAALLAIPLLLSTILLTTKISEGQNVEMKEVYTQYGETRQLTLPDGSMVWMNSGTQLLYPETFGRERQILVRGEVFMDVRHNPRRPFIVHARNCMITVYGTKFNLRSFYEDPALEASLIEGSISLQLKNDPASKEIMMSPGERISVDRTGNRINIEKFNTENYSSWRDNQYTFRYKTLNKITAEMERIFNVRITIMDRELLEGTYLAAFRRGIGLDEMLDALNVGKTLRIKREGDFVEIYKNNP